MASYFYIRVSTIEQNTIRQEVKAKELGIPYENVYIEKASGRNTSERPVLALLLAKLRSGDVLMIDSISRLARSTKDFLELVETITNKGCTIKCFKEPIDTETPQGRCMMTVFAALYQLERENIKQLQYEGICEAKKRGVYKGTKPIPLPANWDKCYRMLEKGEITTNEMMGMVGMKRTTFFKNLKQYRSKDKLT